MNCALKLIMIKFVQTGLRTYVALTREETWRPPWQGYCLVSIYNLTFMPVKLTVLIASKCCEYYL